MIAHWRNTWTTPSESKNTPGGDGKTSERSTRTGDPVLKSGYMLESCTVKMRILSGGACVFDSSNFAGMIQAS